MDDDSFTFLADDSIDDGSFTFPSDSIDLEENKNEKQKTQIKPIESNKSKTCLPQCILAEEASAIYKLLPYMEKYQIYKRLENSSKENRKADVLCRCIQRAVSSQLPVTDYVFDILSDWQDNSNGKFSLMEISNMHGSNDIQSVIKQEIEFINKIYSSHSINLKKEFESCLNLEDVDKKAISLYNRCFSASNYIGNSSGSAFIDPHGPSTSSISNVLRKKEIPDIIDLAEDHSSEESKLSDLGKGKKVNDECEIIFEEDKKAADNIDLTEVPLPPPPIKDTFELDSILWVEAQEICQIVNNLSLMKVYQKLNKYSNAIDRKNLVLNKFLNKAIESPTKRKGKRSSQEKPSKVMKLQDQPSTSHMQNNFVKTDSNIKDEQDIMDYIINDNLEHQKNKLKQSSKNQDISNHLTKSPDKKIIIKSGGDINISIPGTSGIHINTINNKFPSQRLNALGLPIDIGHDVAPFTMDIIPKQKKSNNGLPIDTGHDVAPFTVDIIPKKKTSNRNDLESTVKSQYIYNPLENRNDLPSTIERVNMINPPENRNDLPIRVDMFNPPENINNLTNYVEREDMYNPHEERNELQNVMDLLDQNPVHDIDNVNAISNFNVNNNPNIINGLSREWYEKNEVYLKEMFPHMNNEQISERLRMCNSNANFNDLINKLLEESLSVNVDIAMPGPSTANEEESEMPLTAAEIEETIKLHAEILKEMFADADPEFMDSKAAEINAKQNLFEVMVCEFSEKKDYPKYEEYKKRKERMENRKKFMEGMSIEEFLEYFENAEETFNDTSKVPSQEYIRCGKEQLLVDYPFHLNKEVIQVFKEKNYHYFPAFNELKKIQTGRKTKRANSTGPGYSSSDDAFLKELCYVRMQNKVKEYKKQKEREKKEKFERAKEQGVLQECQCCFDDEVLLEDMNVCDNENEPHLFCNSCIKRHAEVLVGDGKLDFRCLQGECENQFSLAVLKSVLRASVFSNILKRKQSQEIAQAGIDNLVSCPFCNFATIMPNDSDKVFKCLNPECLKDSCRHCKEPNHVPLKCEEVERQKQTDYRTYLENEMTKAIIRNCLQCNKPYIKEEGCNKIRCSCGAVMCYLCKKLIKGYDHFSNGNVYENGKCPLWSNSVKLHAEEVKSRVDELNKEKDPNVQLVHDPTKDLPKIPENLLRKNTPMPQLPNALQRIFGNMNEHIRNRHPHYHHRMEQFQRRYENEPERELDRIRRQQRIMENNMHEAMHRRMMDVPALNMPMPLPQPDIFINPNGIWDHMLNLQPPARFNPNHPQQNPQREQ